MEIIMMQGANVPLSYLPNQHKIMDGIRKLKILDGETI